MIEWQSIVTVLSVLCAIGGFAFARYEYAKRAKKEDISDTRTQVTQDVGRITEVMIKLDHIKDDTTEIKGEIREIKKDVSDLRERVVIVEQSTKSAHKRMDDIAAGKVRNEEGKEKN